jgi:hypothetical protein
MLPSFNREIMETTQITLDVLVAFGGIYILVIVTRNYGWGWGRSKLQLFHRLSLMYVSGSSAWHAYDMWSNPSIHGFSRSNVNLHFSFISLVVVGAVGAWIAQKRTDPPPDYSGNGGPGGPISKHRH